MTNVMILSLLCLVVMVVWLLVGDIVFLPRCLLIIKINNH